MPISLTQANAERDIDGTALKSVVKDLPPEHGAVVALESWLQSPQRSTMKLAWFNDRIVAFAIIEGEQLQALAVHPATRGRGIARRIMTLLLMEFPSMQLAHHQECAVLESMFAQLVSRFD